MLKSFTVIIWLFILGLIAGQCRLNAQNSYLYDILGRLTKISYSDGTVVSYTYDAAGNRLTKGITLSTRASVGGRATLAAGAYHTLFIESDGSLWATGADYSGQLGNGSTTNQSTSLKVSGGVMFVAAGISHSLFIKSDRTLWAMGNNYYGQLGDGSTADRSVPVQVASGVVAVGAGLYHSWFIKVDGSLWAMGDNYYGELGDGTTTARVVPVPIASNVVTAAAGANHTLFVKTDGSLWATGSNLTGQLGDGTTNDRHIPVQVATNVKAVAAGLGHSLFIKTDGTLWAMGNNSYGQLGDGTSIQRVLPVQVASGVIMLSAAVTQSFFIQTDGSLWASGSNNYSQLGDGTTTDRHTPVKIAEGVNSVVAGYLHVVFIKADGSLWVAGDNEDGELGDGSFTSRATPVKITNTIVVAASATSQLINMSVRSSAGSGDQTLIVGFAVGGSGSKQILIRGIGPTLARFGVSGVLASPQLRLFNGSGVQINQNDSWGGSSTMSNAFVSVGAFSLPATSKDSALFVPLPTGSYTAQILTGGSSGITLVEAYDADGSPSSTRFTNLSARNQAGTGDSVLIAGFVIAGTTSKTLLIRGIGPTLASFGVAGVMADPQLQIFDGKGALVTSNDNWGGVSSLSDVFGRVGAFGLPANSKDSALLVTLPAGSYTAQVSGVGGAVGVALVEIYEVP